MKRSKAAERLDAFKAGTGVYAPKKTSQELTELKHLVARLQRRRESREIVMQALKEVARPRADEDLADRAFRLGVDFALKKLLQVMP